MSAIEDLVEQIMEFQQTGYDEGDLEIVVTWEGCETLVPELKPLFRPEEKMVTASSLWRSIHDSPAPRLLGLPIISSGHGAPYRVQRKRRRSSSLPLIGFAQTYP